MALRLWTHLRCEGSEGSEGSKGSEGKVLKMDGPSAQGFLSLTALWAEGGGIALSGDEYEVSVTGCPCCTIWHDKHSTVENHTTAPAERGRSVFPRAKARL